VEKSVEEHIGKYAYSFGPLSKYGTVLLPTYSTLIDVIIINFLVIGRLLVLPWHRPGVVITSRIRYNLFSSPHPPSCSLSADEAFEHLIQSEDGRKSGRPDCNSKR